ncbi:SRPBCC domain-containing protein [Mycetocola sp.]|uniref:SRPBCC domain-containing protein n=1 Tax=Mycetocola sp. TaxID=1871042 RepID=UPI003989D374
MSASQLPQHPIGAQLSNLGSRWLLVLERTLPNAPQEIWAALTEREQVSKWAPFDPDRDLTETGFVALPEAGRRPSDDESDDTDESIGTVVTVAPQRMLSLVWGGDAIDIELAPTASATIVRLSHTFDDRANASSYAAGWHLCLTALDGLASGLDVPRMVGEDAKLHGWDELQERYEKLFGG